MEGTEKESVKKQRFWGLSRKARLAITVLLAVVLLSMISLFFYSSSNKFQILFSGLESKDVNTILAQLEADNIETKIEGDAILVPKEKVDELRLKLASEIKFGSNGYELMDFSDNLGISDQEFAIKKIVMQQGELERTIKSFPQIENARVHITAAKDSVFVENKTPAKAAVYISLSNGTKISNEQVSSIIALVSGSVENLSKDNVEVIDNNMNLLSENLETTNKDYTSSTSVNGQLDLEKKYEEQLQRTVLSLLEPVFGKGKVNVAINADLDFDSKQKTELVIDPNSVIISQEILKESSSSGNINETDSPVDNNMENEIIDTTVTSNSSKDSEITNYETGKVESITITAPGEIKRLTASIIIDGNLDQGTQQTITRLVGSAIGINQERNDEITVSGLVFEKNTETEVEDNTEIFEQMRKEMQTKAILLYGSIAVSILVLIIIIIVIVAKSRKDDSEDEAVEVIDEVETIVAEEPEEIIELNLNGEDPNQRLEEEIKKYATEKPTQVVEIIRSWLSENER